MASRKYAADYRLENVKDKKGRVVTRAVYRGELFSFVKNEDEIRKTKVVFAVSTFLQWVFYLSSLLISSRAGRAMYVTLPFLVSAFPLLGQSDAVWTLWSRKENVIRSDKDKISEKLVSWVFMTFFFSLSSLVAHVVFWIRNGETIGDALFLVLTLLIAASGWNLFLHRKDLEMKATGTTVIPEGE